MRFIFFIVFLGFYLQGFSQGPYAGPVGHATSNAIHKDSIVFQGWASSCQIERGWQQLSDTTLGKASVGDSTLALGKAMTNGVVSLGDGGIATLQFNGLLYDGPGYDFAIFENSFSDSFLELAFVEVSSDGQNFYRFPATSYTDTSAQISAFGTVDATNLNNLAGKYRMGYGTPFDLADLTGNAGLDLQNISHVRVIDVVGSLSNAYGTRDHGNRKINDPFPTPFPSSGFDLDAIGGMYIKSVGQSEVLRESKISIFPNPVKEIVNIDGLKNLNSQYQIFGLNGKLCKEGTVLLNTLSFEDLNSGTYILRLITEEEVVTKRIVKL